MANKLRASRNQSHSHRHHVSISVPISRWKNNIKLVKTCVFYIDNFIDIVIDNYWMWTARKTTHDDCLQLKDWSRFYMCSLNWYYHRKYRRILIEKIKQIEFNRLEWTDPLFIYCTNQLGSNEDERKEDNNIRKILQPKDICMKMASNKNHAYKSIKSME